MLRQIPVSTGSTPVRPISRRARRSSAPRPPSYSLTVKQHASGRWPYILQALGLPAAALSGRNGPCPGCGGRDRFQLTTRGPAADWGRWSCRYHANGGGDGFALVMHWHNCGFGEAVARVGIVLGLQGDVP
jgi:putative DNA primase/helicase